MTDTRTIPAHSTDRPTIPAPPSAHDLVEACRPDLRLPSDALAQAALAIVRDAVARQPLRVPSEPLTACEEQDAVEAEVDAMFAEPECACEHPEEPGRHGHEMCEIDDGELEGEL